MTSEEKDYLTLWCPRFDITVDKIEKWSAIAKTHLEFDKYNNCCIVSVLQSAYPIVRRIAANPNQFSHGKTDLVKKTYHLRCYRDVISEIEFHRKFFHPNILEILDFNFSLANDEIVLIMEYKKGAGYLPSDINEVRSYMKQLLNACVYMRRNLITHNNLKPDNIIFDCTDSVLKIIDLEFCKNVAVQ